MDEKARLLELRKKAKKTKPEFVEKESKHSARVHARWRYPKGRHSAVRQRHGGRPAMPNPGYSSPKAVKGLHSSGLEKVVVHNVTELLAINPKTQGAVFAGNLGTKKRLELLTIALEKKLKVLNFKDLLKLKEKIDTGFTLRKKAKQEKLGEKSKKQEEKKKKAEEKHKKDEEEKKKAEQQKESGVEDTLKDTIKTAQEEQKEIVEKTITKRQ